MNKDLERSGSLSFEDITAPFFLGALINHIKAQDGTASFVCDIKAECFHKTSEM
jgi:hypothetical protein